MRILIYGINYSPELTGIGKYSGEMGAWLIGAGHEVKVVTAPPYYPAWQVAKGYSSSRYQRQQLDGVAVTRCPLWVPSKVGGLTRVVHLMSFALSSAPVALWQALTWRPDIVFVLEPPVFCTPVAWIAARLGGAQAWLHIQDFEIDAAFDLGIVRSKVLQGFIMTLEKWMTRRFDRVSTISDNMIQRLISKGVDPARIVSFPNWADTGFIHPIDRPSKMRAELELSDSQLVYLYSGNMGKKQGLEIIVEAARLRQSDPDGVFILCGDGAVRAELEEMAQGLSNIRFLPLQPLSKLNELMNLADIHLLPQRADVEDLVMPSKLTSMLASGRPIVATAKKGSAVANIVSQCGLVIDPGDVEKFSGALAELASNGGDRRRYGEAGRAYALAHLGKDSILSRVFDESGTFAT